MARLSRAFSMGNGFHIHGHSPEENEPRIPYWSFARPRPRKRLRLALLLFCLTVLSTLFVGTHLTQTYERNLPPYTDAIISGEFLSQFARNPWLLLTGWPFALTLMGILLAHELGHYFACRRYGIVASYPYFLPFPNLIGTLGAFIRIQSPIVHRRALFDVGIAGPLVGFVLAVPALIYGVANSKVMPEVVTESPIVFGNPPLVWLVAKLYFPDVPPDHIFLHPVGRAAWVALFATALNLLPVGQLDGGHIVYALTPRRHQSFSRVFLMALLVAGLFGFWYPEMIWPTWFIFGLFLLWMGPRHPAVLDPGPGLDRRRLWVAALGLLVFILCFTPVPLHAPFEP